MSDLQPYGTQPHGAPAHLQPVAQPVAQAHGWSPAPALLTDQRDPGAGVQVVAWVLAVVTAGYMLPWAIAASRGRANHGSIALINVLLGWSVIGWIASLVMACQAHQVVAAPGNVNVVLAQQFPNAHFAGPVPPVPSVQDGPPAGWYPAPDGAGQQYWDGTTWTTHRAP